MTREELMKKKEGFLKSFDEIQTSLTKELEKEKKWIITFSNGYCGCDIEEEFIGTYYEAVDFAEDYLPDFAESYALAAFGWDWETNEDITEEDMDEYLISCSYDIEESEDEE